MAPKGRRKESFASRGTLNSRVKIIASTTRKQFLALHRRPGTSADICRECENHAVLVARKERKPDLVSLVFRDRRAFLRCVSASTSSSVSHDACEKNGYPADGIQTRVRNTKESFPWNIFPRGHEMDCGIISFFFLFLSLRDFIDARKYAYSCFVMNSINSLNFVNLYARTG